MSSNNIIDKEKVVNITKLARIKVEDSELQHFTDDLDKILNWVVMLNAVDTITTDYDIIVNDTIPTNVLRTDVVTETNNIKSILSNAPEKKFPFFSVPKVIE